MKLPKMLHVTFGLGWLYELVERRRRARLRREQQVYDPRLKPKLENPGIVKIDTGQGTGA